MDEIRDFPVRVGDRTFRVGDIATIERGFSDPAAPRMRFMGQDAIGIAVAMKDGGDIIRLGKQLEVEFARLQHTLPAGMELRKVSDQPHAVSESVGEFVRVLAEAVAIVLVVSFFSLGFRTAFPDNYLRPVARGRSAEEAEARLDRVCAQIRERLGAVVYGEGDETLPEVVGRLLRRAGRSLAVAESCTGGLIAA